MSFQLHWTVCLQDGRSATNDNINVHEFNDHERRTDDDQLDDFNNFRSSDVHNFDQQRADEFNDNQ